MTVQAALVAAVADVYLQGVQSAAPKRWKIRVYQQRQRVAHEYLPEDQRAMLPAGVDPQQPE